jgi:two-component system NarL family response regulator
MTDTDTTPTMITVSILEDDARTLGYLKTFLDGSEHISVIGAYTSGAEALKHIPCYQPDILISDLNLPDISGIKVIQTISEQYENIDILVLTMHDEWEYILPAFKAGATGYILKGTRPAEIIEAIISLKNGGAPMSPKIARHLIRDLKGGIQNRQETNLSEREKDVLKGIANGLSEKKLAERLSLSPHTVHTHIKNIYKKLRVNSKTEALLKARSGGYL